MAGCLAFPTFRVKGHFCHWVFINCAALLFTLFLSSILVKSLLLSPSLLPAAVSSHPGLAGCHLDTLGETYLVYRVLWVKFSA